MEQKIYLDTNLFIYFFEAHPQFAEPVEQIITRSLSDKGSIIASPLTLTELLVGPIRDKNKRLVEVYSHLPQKIPHLTFISFSESMATEAARLRAAHGLPTPDSIHLATAITQNCNTYYTNDRNLLKVKRIKVCLIS